MVTESTDFTDLGLKINNNFWICVGDINRMSSQAHRGGGTACFINYQLWNLLNKAFVEIEPCLDSNN